MAEQEEAYLLRGKIQMDDAYLGRERLGSKAGCGSENKIPIVAAVSLKEACHPIHVRITAVSGFLSGAIADWAERDLAPGSQVLSDGLACFRFNRRFSMAAMTEGAAHVLCCCIPCTERDLTVAELDGESRSAMSQRRSPGASRRRRPRRRERLVLDLVGALALAVQVGTIAAAPVGPAMAAPPSPRPGAAAGAVGGTTGRAGENDAIRPVADPERQGLDAEQRRVRLQSLSAVRADPEAWIGRYLERITTVRAASGRVVAAGTNDLAEAMRRGPLTISADEAKELFSAFAADNRSRSRHSASVHDASLLLTDLLWQRALAQPLNPPRTLVLFSGGGVASGKTSALQHSEAVRNLMATTQILRDSTMANRRRVQSRIDQVLATGRPVQVIYVFTPIEQSVRWLVDRGMREGRAVSAAATARSHWDSQETVLALADHYQGNPAVRIGLLVHAVGADGRLRPIEDLRLLRLAADRRFPDKASLQRYVAKLVQRELQARHRDADPADPSPELEHSLLVVD